MKGDKISCITHEVTATTYSSWCCDVHMTGAPLLNFFCIRFVVGERTPEEVPKEHKNAGIVKTRGR